MSKEENIINLFFLGCIPTRLLLVFIVFYINKKYLYYLSFIGFLISFGFLFNFIFDKKRGSTFNQIAWWNYLRPVHSLLYLIFGYLAYNKNQYSYIPLLIDVLIGTISFIINHKLLDLKKN